jgi:5-methylcytosine-specific restriction endonuclease McrA
MSTLRSDPKKNAEWRLKSAKKAQEKAKEKALSKIKERASLGHGERRLKPQPIKRKPKPKPVAPEPLKASGRPVSPKRSARAQPVKSNEVKQKKVNKASLDRKSQKANRMKLYYQLRLEYLAKMPRCERCGDHATEIHHRSGRTGNNLYLNFMAICRPCHNHVHANITESKKLGYLLPPVSSKFNLPQKG